MIRVESLDGHPSATSSHEVSGELFVTETSALRDSLQQMYEEHNRAFNSMPFNDFYQTFFANVAVLSKISRHYEVYYQNLHLRHREEIDSAWERFYPDEEKRIVIDQIMTTEQEWDDLLKRVDEKMNENWKSAGVANINPGKIQVIDCDANKKIHLKSCLSRRYGRYTLFVLIRYYGCICCLEHVKDIQEKAEQFHKRSCNIVLVCKGSRHGGGKWKKITGVTLSLLADEKQHFVANVKFRRSVWSVCQSRTVSLFASLQLGDKVLDIDDPLHDVYQMGGDVVVDNCGNVVFYHETKTLNDRPTATEILKAIPPATDAPPMSPSRSCSVL